MYLTGVNCGLVITDGSRSTLHWVVNTISPRPWGKVPTSGEKKKRCTHTHKQQQQQQNYTSPNPWLHPSSCCHLKWDPRVRWPLRHKGTRGAMSLCKKTSAQPSGTEIIELEAGESQCRGRGLQSPWACSFIVTYQWTRPENEPFFTSNCIHYIVPENKRISGMKTNTIETKGMKFSWEVGAPATQWVPLCRKLLHPPPLAWLPTWFSASVSAALAAMIKTGENKTHGKVCS